MQTVEKLQKQKAEEALKVLEAAWAYYTPEPLPAAKDEKPAEGFVPYYDAA
ncbi:hypothetical protein ACUXV3_09930 [Roseobacteraceae bacterium NS-SX3]